MRFCLFHQYFVPIFVAHCKLQDHFIANEKKMSKFDKFKLPIKKRKGLLLIITAALILELLSAAQYYFTHFLMEKELEQRAEMELTMKSILIKNTLNSAEDIMKNHIWDIQENLSEPDSVFEAIGRMIMLSRHLKGGAVGFIPNYYPKQGRWFEPYARKEGDSIVKVQIGGPNHDYLNSIPYQQAIKANSEVWIEPIEDKEGALASIITYIGPFYDKSNKLAGAVGIDIDVDWLNDTINHNHIYPSSFVILLTEDGKPIIKPSKSQVSRQNSEHIISLINDSTVVREKSRSGQCTVIKFDNSERNGVIFYAYMKGQPHWQIAVVCYDDEVYASLIQLRIWMLVLMIVAFGILFFMITRFANSEKKLYEKTLEQERIDGELRIANGIQQALLPADEPTLKGVTDISVMGRLIPAKAVGGDLYNAFVRDGKLFFCIGDVSGKGIPSALIMAITQSLFHNIALRESNPAHIMSQLNQTTCRNNKFNVFVTIFIGVLDLPTGHLRYCNAGHEIPLILHQQWKPKHKLLDAKPNLPIGLFCDFNYEMQSMVMEPGTTLFLYTDGLTEARNTERKLFSRERVLQMMEDITTTNPKQLVDAVITQVELYAKNAEQSDDLTLLAIQYTPTEEQDLFNEALTLHNNVKEVTTLSTFIKDATGRLNIEKPLANKLRLALEEAVVNVMEYAYPAGKTGDINIRVTSDGHRLKFIITDAGVSFDPTEASTTDTTLSVEERPIGGLGILLVRELMDSINYERTDGQNVLTLTKIIHQP